MKNIFKITLIITSLFFIGLSVNAQDFDSEFTEYGMEQWFDRAPQKADCKVVGVKVKDKKGVILKLVAVDNSFAGKFLPVDKKQETMLQIALAAYLGNKVVTVKFETTIAGNILYMIKF